MLNKKDNDKVLRAVEKLRKAKYCFGVMSNTVWHDFHVLFFDFDGNYKIGDVTISLLNTQKKYDLSTIYILESSNGFNAFCLDQYTIKKIKEILDYTSLVDPLFIELGFIKNNCYILRMDLDKKLVNVLSNRNNAVLSNSHRWFFQNIMQFNIEDRHIYDDNYKFRVVAYKSVKHGYCELYD